MSLTHRRVYFEHTTDSSHRNDTQANHRECHPQGSGDHRESHGDHQTCSNHPNIVHHRRRSGSQLDSANHRTHLNQRNSTYPEALSGGRRNSNKPSDSSHPSDSNQPSDSNHLGILNPNDSNYRNNANQSTNLDYLNRVTGCLLHKCFASYLLLICLLNVAQAAPLPSSNLINLNDHVNANPLNQFLKEPELVKVYKDRVVFRIFPLAKKDVEIR